MYVRAFPASSRASVEAQLKVGVPAAAANPAPHVEGAARDAVAVGEFSFVFFAERTDARAKFFGDALVGVETEDPVVLRCTSGELLLRREAGPVALDDTRPALGGYLARGVGRVRVNDQNLVGPRDRLAGGAYMLGLVEGDDGR